MKEGKVKGESGDKSPHSKVLLTGRIVLFVVDNPMAFNPAEPLHGTLPLYIQSHLAICSGGRNVGKFGWSAKTAALRMIALHSPVMHAE